MQVGLLVPNYAAWFRGEALAKVVQTAEDEIGVDSLWFVDHVIVPPEDRLRYGNGYLDTYTAMTYVAALTKRVKLGTTIIVVPHRPPIQQAKVVASLDSLSGGRVILGMGTGYNEGELSALGVKLEERSERTDEYLRCMIELWTHDVATFHGKYVDFEERSLLVRPAQQPHPPLWMGGRGPRPFRRVAQIGQGWLPGGGGNPEQFEQDVTQLLRIWQEHGRKGKPDIGMMQFMQLVGRGEEAGGTSSRGESNFLKLTPDQLVDRLRMYADLGVDHFNLHFPSFRMEGRSNLDVLLEQMHRFGDHVLPRLPKS